MVIEGRRRGSWHHATLTWLDDQFQTDSHHRPFDRAAHIQGVWINQSILLANVANRVPVDDGSRNCPNRLHQWVQVRSQHPLSTRAGSAQPSTAFTNPAI